MFIEIGLTRKEIQKIKLRDKDFNEDLHLGSIVDASTVLEASPNDNDIDGNILMCYLEVNDTNINMCSILGFNMVMISNIIDCGIVGYNKYIGR